MLESYYTKSYYEYDTPCTCAQETNIQNRIHGNAGTTGTTKSTVTKKGPEVVNKTITENGKYTILPSGNADSISAAYLDVDVHPLIWDVDGMKYQYSTITKFPDNWRFAPRTGKNCSNMFGSCSSLPSLDLSSFDTSKVTCMDNMFIYNTALKSLDLSSFDTSNVTDMGYMFMYCKSLTSLDLSSFDTHNVTNIWSMFSDCTSLISLDLSNSDMSKVTISDTIFYRCSKLQTITKGSFKNLKISLDLSDCVVLSKQSVVDLFDSIGTANSRATITLASAVYSQLSADEIKVATDKGWTVASN